MNVGDVVNDGTARIVHIDGRGATVEFVSACIQAEHKAWVDVEYPGQPKWQPAAGMLEEAGELLRVVLKHNQHLQFGVEERYKGVDWDAELVDAIGDCAIFCCSLCNASGWSFDAMVKHLPPEHPTGMTTMSIALRLVLAAVSVCEPPHMRCYAELYIVLLKTLSEVLSVDFDYAVARTWSEVKKRRHAR